MTLSEIQQAVESGQTVCWRNVAYRVVRDSLGQWFIKCMGNNHLVGLTWADGATMNGKPEEFYIHATSIPVCAGGQSEA